MNAGRDTATMQEVADQFGVAAEQVRRDHLISHILSALSRELPEQVIFFGGTALARTHLPAGRLSEDIDLIAVGERTPTAASIERVLATALRRSHGRIQWAPALSAVRDTQPAVLMTGDRELAVRIQLLSRIGYEPWPTEQRAIVQRYADVTPASLRVPTLDAFVAWKTAAWQDRAAPRDLYDLWALSRIGAMNATSAALFARHGPTGSVPRPWTFTTAPTEQRWREQLANQTTLRITAAEALQAVRAAWASAIVDSD